MEIDNFMHKHCKKATSGGYFPFGGSVRDVNCYHMCMNKKRIRAEFGSNGACSPLRAVLGELLLVSDGKQMRFLPQ